MTLETETETVTEIETEARPLPDGSEMTQAIVKFELPEEIVEEVLDEHGELDPDALSDRLVPIPVVDDEPV